MRNKALIVVDMQEDFLPGGALGVDLGHVTIPKLEALMDDVDIIVFTRDYHPADHCSFSDEPEYRDGSWPSHCVQDTEGVEFDERLFTYALDTGKPVFVVNKGMDPEREEYSGFAAGAIVTEAYNVDQPDQWWNQTLREALIAKSAHEVKIGGLALDYCVKNTALDCARTGFHTTVYLDATRPVDYLTGTDAVVEMANSGVVVVGKRLT